MLGKKEIREILQSRFKDDLHTKISQIPRPEALKDVYKAAQRIKKALQMGEKIVIVGDYDVDGIVSSVILSDFLKKLGANLCVKIPNRFTDVSGRARRVVPMDGPDHEPDDVALHAARLAARLGLERADAAWTDSWRRAVADLPEPDCSSSPDALARAVWEASQAPGAPTLLLGSSMTVRRLDRLAQPGAAAPKAVANRGLAGIDGTIATGIGLWMASGAPVRAVMGDLAFLHDAMSLSRGVREEEADLQVIVVDDGGGAIFSQLEYARTMPAGRLERLFTAPQRADIAALAAALGARVHVPNDVAALRRLLAEPVDGMSVVIWETTRHGPHTVTT